MRRGAFALLIAMLIGIGILAGCSGSSGSAGPAGAAGSTGATGPAGPTMPVIQSLAVAGAPAIPGNTITAQVVAQSAQGLPLTYSWTVSGITGTGWSVTTGTTTTADTVAITASTGYGATARASVVVSDGTYSAVGTIALSTIGDTAPVINSLSVYPPSIVTTANLVASAFDQNSGDTLAYVWSVGGLRVGDTSSSATWTSPGIPGYYNVSLTVSDGTYSVSGNSFTSLNVGSRSPWPKFRRDAQGTGVSPMVSESTGVHVWSFNTSTILASSPAIGFDGAIYITADDGNLYAIDATGSIRWAYVTGDAGMRSSPAIGSDGTVYIGSASGLHAVGANAISKWTYTSATGPDLALSAPALAADGTVYIGSNDGNLYAINSDGTEKWKYDIGVGTVASPAVGADGTIYFGSAAVASYVFAITPAGGMKWMYYIDTGAAIDSSPAVGADGTVYAGASDGIVYAINNNGTARWTYSTGGEIHSSPAIGSDGTIYIGSDDGNLYAINCDGTFKWSVSTFNAFGIRSSPAVDAAGNVFVGDDEGNLYAFDRNGNLLWSYTADAAVRSSPAIGSDGTIYVGSDDGYVYAIN